MSLAVVMRLRNGRRWRLGRVSGTIDVTGSRRTRNAVQDGAYRLDLHGHSRIQTEVIKELAKDDSVREREQ